MPFGKVRVVIENAPLTVTEYVRAAVRAAASVGVMVNVEVPAAVGVPLMAPVLAFRVRPAGRGSGPRAKVTGLTPPVVTIVALYATPRVPEGNVTVVFVNAFRICTVYDWVLFSPPLSVTIMPKEVEPTAVGVPEITPVLGARVKPGGKDPVEI